MKKHHNVISVYHQMRGLSDIQIVDLARNQQTIILTEDKDFGEFVFAHKIHTISVVLLRYHFKERQEMFKIMEAQLANNSERFINKFTTIKTNSIRIRNIE